jgi:predicted phage baseplate assembly protein
MSALAPNLFERRFPDLVEIGRARLRPLAPEWTDHNAHDPGITLMELLAWVAEAQLYSVSRLRKDERAAYAALLGLHSSGTRGSRGLIWPDRLDPNSPAATFARTTVVPTDAVVHVANEDSLTFRPTYKLLWTPGRVTQIVARSANGRSTDLTSINARGGPAFLPFGESAGRRDRLALTFECRDEDGLFGKDREATAGAFWTIGVLAAPPSGGAAASSADGKESKRPPLSATLVTEDERFPLTIVSDTTRGMLTTGALVLDLQTVTSSPRTFTIELQSPRGFARPPRVLRINPNVVPIVQGRPIDRELQVATGLPDWGFTLNVPGLRFEAGEDPVKLEVAEPTGLSTWRRARLVESGPDDRVYEIDSATGHITFGNGINGRIPAAVSQVLITYAVSDGENGNVGRNRKWNVAGFGGSFGLNLDPISGGAAPFGWLDERRAARRRSRDEHALVSESDIVDAAKAIPLLEVVRAWIARLAADAPRSGVVTLTAMRSRPGDIEPESTPETARWLEAIRRRLVSRIPLATRLMVRAPRYTEFSIRASIETHQGRDPAAIKDEIVKALRRRLALVELTDGTAPRQPGVPVTHRDVVAWIRRVDGVRRIVSLELRDADGRTADEIAVAPDGLPRWMSSTSTFDVARPATGGAR